MINFSRSYSPLLVSPQTIMNYKVPDNGRGSLCCEESKTVRIPRHHWNVWKYTWETELYVAYRFIIADPAWKWELGKYVRMGSLWNRTLEHVNYFNKCHPISSKYRKTEMHCSWSQGISQCKHLTLYQMCLKEKL